MQGSLCLHRGVVYVGRQAKTASVQAYDLDGRELVEGFKFRDARLNRSVAAGLAVDDDRHVWVADTPASRVRMFTVFGSEIGGLGLSLEKPLSGPGTCMGDEGEVDVAGFVRRPLGVVARGDSDGLRLTVACGGERRHGIQVFAEDGRLIRSLRPEGRPHGRFRGVRGVSERGRFVYVAEAGAGRVQVFRDGDFHFAFDARLKGRDGFEPTALAPLEDGRLVVTHGGAESALLLFDAAGRLLKVLAEAGVGEGSVFEPNDVVVEEGADDLRTRLVVVDRDGDRVQVYTLAGRCYGAFGEQAG